MGIAERVVGNLEHSWRKGHNDVGNGVGILNIYWYWNIEYLFCYLLLLSVIIVICSVCKP